MVKLERNNVTVVVRVRLHLAIGLTDGEMQLTKGLGWEYASDVSIYMGL